MRPVVEEAERTATRGGVVDNLGNHRVVLAEVKFIANADLARRFYQHIPEFVFGVELAQQEYLYASPGLLFVAVEQCGEDACVVEYHHVAIVEKLKDVFEDMMRDFACATVYYHQTGFVAFGKRVTCYKLVGEIEFEL